MFSLTPFILGCREVDAEDLQNHLQSALPGFRISQAVVDPAESQDSSRRQSETTGSWRLSLNCKVQKSNGVEEEVSRLSWYHLEVQVQVSWARQQRLTIWSDLQSVKFGKDMLGVNLGAF
jgi:hypothetical protein